MLRQFAQSAVARVLVGQLHWLILAVMLGITGFAWHHEREAARTALHSQFDFALRETVNRIEQRVQGYEQMLRGVQSLFATTPWRNRAAMHAYVQALQLDANFAGVQTIGVIDWVSESHKQAHVAAMHALGFSNYRITPDGVRDRYAPVVQREPYVGRNRAAFGYDTWSDPVRRAALERARDSGLAAISGKVALQVDAGGPTPPGFILYLPVYAQGQARDTIAQRRANLVGWVYASFHMKDFMASLYGSQSPGLSLAVYDGTQIDDAQLMYRSDAASAPAADAISAVEYLVVAGHSWALSLRTQDLFGNRYGRSMDTRIAMVGLILGLSLAWLTWLMVHGRERALNLAATMTEELRHMAQHDPLTGLPNRALFNDRLRQELARAKRQRGRFAMLFIDLDGFKPINDRFGHGVGDQVLKRVARHLQDSVRAADTVGRMGGDEFVVLLAELSNTDSVSSLAEKLHCALKQPFMVDGREFSVSSCIGVAVYPEDGDSAVALLKGADDAMYRAKEDGRNCVRVSKAGV